jgi:hypothetical protein
MDLFEREVIRAFALIFAPFLAGAMIVPLMLLFFDLAGFPS